MRFLQTSLFANEWWGLTIPDRFRLKPVTKTHLKQSFFRITRQMKSRTSGVIMSTAGWFILAKCGMSRHESKTNHTNCFKQKGFFQLMI